MKITREIDPNELIISHRFTYQANGRIIGLRRVPEASNILCLRHGSSVWILVCSSYGHFCCSGCSSPVDFGMSVNCYGFFLQTINGSSECTCWSKKNHGHISESCSQRLRGDEQHSLLIIRLIPSCPPYVGLSGRFSQATCDTNSCTTTTQIKINSQMLKS